MTNIFKVAKALPPPMAVADGLNPNADSPSPSPSTTPIPNLLTPTATEAPATPVTPATPTAAPMFGVPSSSPAGKRPRRVSMQPSFLGAGSVPGRAGAAGGQPRNLGTKTLLGQ